MCGLVGVCTWQEQNARDVIDRGLSALIHRGPDDVGSFIQNGEMAIGLGLRRLAIQDLSVSGHQPMSTKDGRYVISFNGEITNFIELRGQLEAIGFIFESKSDTEVLLKAWVHMGADCLKKLEGMFAFAIYDKVAQTVTLARDSFGIKPLFFSSSEDGSFYFSSEMQSLARMMSGRLRLNVQRSIDYLQWGLYDESDETFVDGVRQLLPGHLMTFSLAASKISNNQAYWFPSIDTLETSFSNASDHVRELFLDSVRRNMIADVPIGVALSGGIDSSSIARAISLLNPDVPFYAFSYIAEGQPYSELEWIKQAINDTRAQFHPITIADTDLSRDLNELIISQGEPFGSTSVYAQWRVFRAVREDGIVVTLDGQGADEIFAGYNGYPSSRLRSLVHAGKLRQAANFLSAWSTWPGRSRLTAISGALAEASPDSVYSLIGRFTRKSMIPYFNKPALQELEIQMGFPRRILGGPITSSGNRLKEELRSTFRYRGLPALLRHGDRNSMNASVESRVPFLDRQLVEYAMSLPENYLIDDHGSTKSVFRSAMRGIVPDSILDRRDKIGFETPQNIWLNQVFREHGRHLNDLLNSSKIFAVGNRSADEFWSQLRDSPTATWRVINFLKWLELFDIDENL